MQALEAARTVEEGVITDVREADVGSILGFGFAPFSGGTLSYIDMMGTKAFVELCKTAREEIRPALQAAEAAHRHGGEGRDVLRPLRARQAQGGVKSRQPLFPVILRCPRVARASKDRRGARAVALRGSLRSHLRVTDQSFCERTKHSPRCRDKRR